LEKPDLIVVVHDGDIVVRTLGFYAVYYKPTNEPALHGYQRRWADGSGLAGSQRQGARARGDCLSGQELDKFEPQKMPNDMPARSTSLSKPRSSSVRLR
jgi:hypothetical protein